MGAAGATGAGLPALPPGAQAVSLLGDTLHPPDLPPTVREEQEAALAEARAELESDPEDPEALIWVGRRLAYLGQYRKAIGTFTRGIELHPDDPRFLRHRGHRYITVRELERAEADLERAAHLVQGEPDGIEPDGLPNPLGIPTSTLHFNIYYHLGLARYLQGDFEAALDAYRACLEASVHPDSVVATSYWLYLTLRRLGMDEEASEVLAPIHAEMEIIESASYLDLLRLFKGEVHPGALLGPTGEDATLESTTLNYGVGAWHWVNGRQDEAQVVFLGVLRGGDRWPAFGYIAAEAEIARLHSRG